MLRVATFIDTYLPGYRAGGPIASVSRIIERESGASFRVITRNHDLGDTTPYPGARPRVWHSLGRAEVAYLRSGIGDWRWVRSEILKWSPDAYFFNGLQNPEFSLLPLLLLKLGVLPRRSIVIAPRGQANPAALRLKQKKKRLFRPLIKCLLSGEITWQLATSDELRDTIAWWGGALPSSHRVAIRGEVGARPLPQATSGPEGDFVAVTFASRIDPMKGLDEAIRIVGGLNCKVIFNVHGVISDSRYWTECLELARTHLDPSAFHYFGPYKPEDAQQIFSDSSVLLLPTRGENFGHVLAEALSVGCPVVVGPKTPWSELVDGGAGHVIVDHEGAVRYIDELARTSVALRRANRVAVLRAYTKWFESSTTSEVFSLSEHSTDHGIVRATGLGTIRQTDVNREASGRASWHPDR